MQVLLQRSLSHDQTVRWRTILLSSCRTEPRNVTLRIRSMCIVASRVARPSRAVPGACRRVACERKVGKGHRKVPCTPGSSSLCHGETMGDGGDCGRLRNTTETTARSYPSSAQSWDLKDTVVDHSEEMETINSSSPFALSGFSVQILCAFRLMRTCG